jgi:hypothetical protein
MAVGFDEGVVILKVCAGFSLDIMTLIIFWLGRDEPTANVLELVRPRSLRAETASDSILTIAFHSTIQFWHRKFAIVPST